ncbi:MAG TPA: aromatic amino acid lyase, partial [Solirubrobacteraceae bacterium]|nr:aromatic amino acid lyase [Solirubrobacteraceae bacterium]
MNLDLATLERVARGGTTVALGAEERARMDTARGVVERAIAEGRVVYGVTTGFGQLSDVRIPADQAAQLQLNLLRSHAVGIGEPLDEEVVRGMLLALAASLSRGRSGARTEVVELLLALLERGVTPVVPSRGSVGSSGDLAPLAHVGLVLVGEGEATVDGRRVPGADALAQAGLRPLALAAKEGLAIVNGTHLMSAVGALAVRDARRLLGAATVAVALSLEAFKGSTVPFHERLHSVRPHPGQQRVAARLRELLDDSPIVASHADCGRVQDPYTLRCAPQVLGAVQDAVEYVAQAIERELAAVTDNPLVFPDDDEILSGGNFHGQPVSLPLDHLALALTELAAFSERRTYALLSPSYAGLPPFLTPHPGLSSGLMIAQYAAA